MESVLFPILITVAAVGAGLAVRMREATRQTRETARMVEAERIVALLSNRQPGVWDQDELRSRVQQTARDFWLAPTREALAGLAQWVGPELLASAREAWPSASVKRESTVAFEGRVAFMHVSEGGEPADRLIARLVAKRETRWLDANGKAFKHDRPRTTATFHTWIHIDGQGWQLTAIAEAMPSSEPPPSSVSCRILPQPATEPLEHNP